jgi:hypothetical protein
MVFLGAAPPAGADHQSGRWSAKLRLPTVNGREPKIFYRKSDIKHYHYLSGY